MLSVSLRVIVVNWNSRYVGSTTEDRLWEYLSDNIRSTSYMLTDVQREEYILFLSSLIVLYVIWGMHIFAISPLRNCTVDEKDQR